MPLIAFRKLPVRRDGCSTLISAGGSLLLLSAALVGLGACASPGSDELESGATGVDAAGQAGVSGVSGVSGQTVTGVAAVGGGDPSGSAGVTATRPAGTGSSAPAAPAAGSGGLAATGAAAASGGIAGNGGIGANTVAAANGGVGANGAGAGNGGLAASGGASVAGSGGAPSMTAAGSGAAGLRGNISVWLAGDSTVAKGETPCPVGWGAEFQPLFKPEAKVVNSAVGGRSVRTWLYEVQTTMDSSGECGLNKDSSGEPVLQARWQMMLDAMSGMQTGDYLFIQFGINDSSATCDRHVGLDAFKESYGMMAEAAKKRGAQPIFVTPVSAIACNGSTAKPTRGNFVTATTEAGKQYDVPVIDLHARSIDLYNKQGLCPIPGGSDVSASTGGKTGAFFCDDHTHFSNEGAPQIAKLVADALRDQSIGLAAYLK